MTNNVYSLKEMFHDHPEITDKLEFLVREGLLHPDAKVRRHCLSQLGVVFDGHMVAGYMGDNQLFIEVELAGERGTVYVCDMPSTYFGKKSKVHAFSLDCH